MIFEGVANLTPTENKLRNFSRICKLVGDYGGVVEYKELINIVLKDPTFKRGKRGKEGIYTKTIERHINIAEKLGILYRSNQDVDLSSLGRSLYELLKKIDNSEENLDDSEKIFYFMILFSQPTVIQLVFLLKSMENKGKLNKDKVIRKYIQSLLTLPPNVKIFDRTYLRECLRKKETRGVFPRGVINKFECMRGWLRDLGLIKTKGLGLTPSGRRVLSELKSEQENIHSLYSFVTQNVMKLAQSVLNPTARFPLFDKNNAKHMQLFESLFIKAYKKFYRPSIKMSDLIAIRTWLLIRLLVVENIILEINDFNYLIENKVMKGTLKSIARDEKGRLAYVEI